MARRVYNITTTTITMPKPQSRADSKVKVLKHLIPKPPVSAGRNYNLQHAMGLSDTREAYLSIMKRVRIACSEHPDIRKRINRQNQLVLYRLIASVNAETKFPRQFLANRGVASRTGLTWKIGCRVTAMTRAASTTTTTVKWCASLFPPAALSPARRPLYEMSLKEAQRYIEGRTFERSIEQEYSKHACTTKQKHPTYDRSQRTSSIPVASTSTSTSEIKNQTKKRAADYKVGAVPLRANKEVGFPSPNCISTNHPIPYPLQAIYEDTFTTSVRCFCVIIALLQSGGGLRDFTFVAPYTSTKLVSTRVRSLRLYPYASLYSVLCARSPSSRSNPTLNCTTTPAHARATGSCLSPNVPPAVMRTAILSLLLLASGLLESRCLPSLRSSSGHVCHSPSTILTGLPLLNRLLNPILSDRMMLMPSSRTSLFFAPPKSKEAFIRL
ncbi:hypothetical protein IMY05_C4724000100 [Salix suchowensis]|nr:hypothetical protein IMY05_C4724000100 [Salix suchowensis]